MSDLQRRLSIAATLHRVPCLPIHIGAVPFTCSTLQRFAANDHRRN